MSRMGSIDRAADRYRREIAAATDRAEATIRTTEGRCEQVIAAAHKAIEAAEAEADGVTRSAAAVAEAAIQEATRRLDAVLAEAIGAPSTASVRDVGNRMEVYVGGELVGTAEPSGGSYVLSSTVCPTEVTGAWIAARQWLWRASRVRAEASRPLPAVVTA